jgi:hypothetical protein
VKRSNSVSASSSLFLAAAAAAAGVAIAGGHVVGLLEEETWACPVLNFCLELNKLRLAGPYYWAQLQKTSPRLSFKAEQVVKINTISI